MFSSTLLSAGWKSSASTVVNSFIIAAASAPSSRVRFMAALARALAPCSALLDSSTSASRNLVVSVISALSFVAMSAMRTVLRYGSASRSSPLAAMRKVCAASSFSRASSIKGSAADGVLVAAFARSVWISISSASASFSFSSMDASSGLSAVRAEFAWSVSSETLPSNDALASLEAFVRAAASSGARVSPDASIERIAARRSAMPVASADFSCATRSRSMRSSIMASRRMRLASVLASLRCESLPAAAVTSEARVRSSLAASAGASSPCTSSLVSPPSTASVFETASGE